MKTSTPLMSNGHATNRIVQVVSPKAPPPAHYSPPESLPFQQLRIDIASPPDCTAVEEHNQLVEQLAADFASAVARRPVDLRAVELCELVSERSLRREAILKALQRAAVLCEEGAAICRDCVEAWKARREDLQKQLQKEMDAARKSLAKLFPKDDPRRLEARINEVPSVAELRREIEQTRSHGHGFTNLSLRLMNETAPNIEVELERYCNFIRE